MSSCNDLQYQLEQQAIEEAKIENGQKSSEPFDWTKPPSDINSAEYREWYEEYCRLYYLMSYGNTSSEDTALTAASSTVTTSAIETSLETVTPIVSESYKDNLSIPEILKSKDNQEDHDKLISKETKCKRKANKRKAEGWVNIDPSKTKAVTIKGLPEDIKEQELIELMNKAGAVGLDPYLRTPRVTIFRDESGKASGEARYFFMKPDSVQLAITLLDEYEIKPNIKISVEKTIFKLEGDYDPSRKKKKLTKNEYKKLKSAYDKVTTWNEHDESDKPKSDRQNYERVCVIKNVFEPQQFEDDFSLVEDLQTEMTEECQKYGKLKKVVVCHLNEEGVVLVYYKEPEHADACIQAVNGRWFDKRQLKALNWDGKTKYIIEETEEQKEKRTMIWHKLLEGEQD